MSNSLTHLTYLTSTSPRTREILTSDGGPDRLVRLLRDFYLSPPPPENPSAIYGLLPPGLSRPPPIPILNPNPLTGTPHRFFARISKLSRHRPTGIGAHSEP
ncbi:hypothetical protein DFH11DRAFT_1644379 [Phellopilus nigrolimitatus]|nr:hypothetical protein DFH11DRAFT_1644379 [Phellopilus nigrolimitatus]